jgi:predicted TIM-barrel enzyme
VVQSREALLKRFRDKINRGLPIIGGGAGTGISAKFEEAGGIDLIVIYNSGRFRMAGHGSLAGLMPFGDANQIVLDMAGEVLPVVKRTPVLAGVCGTDPMRLMDRFLRTIKEVGFAGVQNFPTVGLIDGTFRANLEETKMGYDREVEMIRLAHEMDLLTTPYVFNPEEAVRMTKAGADILVAHMGLTTSGSIGAATAKSLEDCVTLIDEIATVARATRDDVILLCHGGPIAEPDDAAFILQNCPAVDGFYGASSMERLPTEQAIRQQTERFVNLRRTARPSHAQADSPKPHESPAPTQPTDGTTDSAASAPAARRSGKR